MEKQKSIKGIELIIAAYNSLSKLLAQSGAFSKKLYWLGRNLDGLEPLYKNWQKQMQSVFQGYAEEVPAGKVIPANAYTAFKKELLTEGCLLSEDTILKIMEKYETQEGKGEKAILPHNFADYQKAVQDLADSLSEEIEYMVVDLDDDLEKVIAERLTGNEARTIFYMLRYPSEE